MGKRYLTLDAMRGIAAVIVVVYHSAVVTDAACTQATCNVRFGYLAVDMFFALSGFVLSHGYDRRFAEGLSVAAFMKARLVRLMPVYWLAFLIALPLAMLDLMKGAMSAQTLLGSATFNAAILPWYGGQSTGYAVAIVRPAWSLFFELWVANLVFALFWRQLRGINLAVLIGLAAIGLLIGVRSYGSLDMGPIWSTVPGGFARVVFSFFLGVALRRGSARITVPTLPPLLVLAAMTLTFFVPVAPGWHTVFELTCVAIVYPAIILAGAAAAPRFETPARLLGDASYALYLIHMPMIDLGLRAMHRLNVAPRPAVAACLLVASLALALLVDRFYDRRARRALEGWLAGRAKTRGIPDLSTGTLAPAAALP